MGVSGELRYFGLLLPAEDAPAEPDGLARLAVNGEHQAAPETVKEAAPILALESQARTLHLLGREAFALETPCQVLARAIRVSQAEFFRDGGSHAALGQVFAARRTVRAAEIGAEDPQRQFVHLEHGGAQPGFLVGVLGPLGHANAVAIGQEFEGLIETEALDLHDELDDVAPGAAAEALVELVRLVD